MPVIELLSVAARLVVGATLFTAGLAKFAAPDEFARSLSQYPLPRFVGDFRTRRLAGLALAAIELGVGACFALGLAVPVAGMLTLGLLAGFSVALALMLVRGRNAPCGCFGSARRKSTQREALARNALLALLAVAGLQSTGLSLDALDPGTFASEALAVVLAALAAATVFAAWSGSSALPQLRPVLAGEAPQGRALPRGGADLRSRLGTVLAKAKARGGASPKRAARPAPHREAAESAPDAQGKLAGLYTAAAEAQRKGAALTLELDRKKIAAPRPPSEGAPKPRRKGGWEKLEAELTRADESLGRELQALYKAAAAIEPPAADRALVRTALLHWTVLLRQRAMEGFHTAVPGLADDPECDGDLIADELLLRYFDALFRDPKKLRRELKDGRATTQYEAVTALTEIARQSACLGAQQSALLASHLYHSFVALVGFLRLNGQERIVPYVVQAAAQPMLLFYDVEKHRGPYSPLARWFAEYQATLAAGVDTRRVPASWHGLWLYDWRSGHLVGYRISDDPRDENDVDGQLFFDSIARRENLGKYDCSFSEMVERGPGRAGYFCAGSSCADDAGAPRGHLSAREQRGGLTGWLVGLFRLGDVGGSSARMPGPSGLLGNTACGESVGDSGAEGGRGGRCDGGLEAAGRTRESEAVRCLSEQVTSQADQMMSCMGEGTGRCADPIGQLAKDLAATSYAGVKLGRDCGLKEEAGGTETETDAEKKFDEALDQLEQEDAEYQEAKDEAAEAETDRLEAEQAQQEAQEATQDNGTSEEWDKYIEAQNAYQAAADAAAAAQGRADKEQIERNYALLYAEIAYQNKKNEGNKRCPPDTPDCGGNDCSGMSNAMKQTMDCMAKLLDPQAGGPGGPAPEWWPGQEPVVDPNPEEPGDVKMHPCFEMLGEEGAAPGINTSKGCWVYDCGPEMHTGTGPGGCTCGQPEAMGLGGQTLAGNCGDVYCAEGSPVFRNGHCTCGDEPALGGGGRIAKTQFELPKPLSFSSVHTVQFGPDWRESSSAGSPSPPSGYPRAGTYPF